MTWDDAHGLIDIKLCFNIYQNVGMFHPKLFCVVDLIWFLKLLVYILKVLKITF